MSTAARCYLRYRRQGWCREAARTLASRPPEVLDVSLRMFLIFEGAHRD